MEIQYLSFDDYKEHWHLQETYLDPFNLLVGISGVGKTLITEAIRLICQVATENNYQLEGLEWKIGFVHEGQKYEWTLNDLEQMECPPGYLTKASLHLKYLQ